MDYRIPIKSLGGSAVEVISEKKYSVYMWGAYVGEYVPTDDAFPTRKEALSFIEKKISASAGLCLRDFRIVEG